MRLIAAHKARLLEWAASRLKTDGWPERSEPLGVIEDRDGKPSLLRAVIVINEVYGGRCSVHIASDGSQKWATRDILTRISAYVHLAKKVDRMSATIAAANVPAQIAALKIGFRIEGRVRLGADDGTDGIVFSMLRNENPWLKDTQDG